MSVCRSICARLAQTLSPLMGEEGLGWKKTAALATAAAASGGLSFWYGAGLAGASAISALTTWGFSKLGGQETRAELAAAPILAPVRERTVAEAAAHVAIYERIFGESRVRFDGTLFQQADQISTWMNQNRGALERYTELDLSHLRLQMLPSEIRLFQNLQRLNLSHNRLQTLPPEIGNLLNLRVLGLSDNRLQTLPPEIGNLLNLRVLRLSNNQLQALLSEIGNLLNLRVLNLRGNRLQTLPPAIGNLLNLRVLGLSVNRIQTLPPEIGNLLNLRVLSLWGNQLQTLPPEIRNLLNLRVLSLWGNQLQTLPPEIGNLQNLRVLNLWRNQLQTLPPEIGNLQNLQRLDLSRNQFQTLPPEIGNLQNLQRLYLSENRLQTLPPEIGNLLNLRELYLSENQLQTLPESIMRLSSECTVDAQRNRFTAAYAQAFVAALERHRAANPLQGPNVQVSIHDAPAEAERQVHRTVEQELAAWAQEIAAAFPEKGESAETTLSSWLNTLDEDAKSALQTYLQKVRGVSDYQNGGDGKINIIRRVNEMIELASKNQEFRAALLGIIYEGNETCGDRVLLIFNDIEILTKMYGEELTDYEFSKLAMRASCYELLKKFAKKVAQQNRLGDQIETILYYLVMLQEDLDLPTTAGGMLYAGMAGVSQEMLQAAREEISRYTDLELLAASDYWLSRMERKNPERVQRINEEYGELLGIAQELDYSARPLKVENDRLKEMIRGKKCSNYQELSDLIDQKRREAIASIETASAAAGNE